MKYLFIGLFIWFSNYLYSSDTIVAENRYNQRAKSIAECDYDEINSLYAQRELEGCREDAIIALNREFKEGKRFNALRLMGLIYEEMGDYKNSVECLRTYIGMSRLIFKEQDLAHLSMFDDLKRVKGKLNGNE